MAGSQGLPVHRSRGEGLGSKGSGFRVQGFGMEWCCVQGSLNPKRPNYFLFRTDKRISE